MALPKPNKRYLSPPQSRRPITLLPCFGKGLGRLITKRISHIAVQPDIISTQKFGALSKRIAADLISSLVHDIERARSYGKVSSLHTPDVKGAFDTAQPGHL